MQEKNEEVFCDRRQHSCIQHASSKLHHIRRGDARVFGEDSDIRRRLNDKEATNRFGEVWKSILEPEIRTAPKITVEDAKELLEGKQQDYAIAGFQFRQFSIQAAVFVARLNKDATKEGVCDQLWSIGMHRDNTRLCMYFNTVEEKDQFVVIAKQLGWKPQELALQLVMDFAAKFHLQ